MASKSSGTLADQKTGTGSGNGVLERVTVNLTPRAVRALHQAVSLTGDSKTDTINRALQLYAYLEEVMQADGTVFVKTADDPELKVLKVF